MLQQRIKQVKADIIPMIDETQSEFAEARAAHDEEWLKVVRSKLKLFHEEIEYLGMEQRRLERQMLDVKARQSGTVCCNKPPSGCAGISKGNHRLLGIAPGPNPFVF